MEYVNSASVRDKRSWLSAEVAKFRNYPNLELAFRLIKAGRLLEAKVELDKVLGRDPENLAAASLYLLVLHDEHDYQGVIRRSDSILNRHNSFAPALMYRGLARQALGQREKALQDFTALAGLPDLTRGDRIFSLDMVIDLALAEQHYDQALKAIETIGVLRNDSRLYYRKSLVLQGMGRTNEAADALSEALHLASDAGERVKLLQALGDLHRKRGDWRRASEAYHAALELNSASVVLLRCLADAAYQMGNYGEVSRRMREVLAIKPNPQDRQYLANILLAEKNYTAAELEFRKMAAETRDPKFLIPAYRSLIELARLRKDDIEAIRILRLLIGLRATPRDRSSLLALLEKQKDYPAMIRELDAILALKTTDAAARYDAYIKLGNIYQTEREYERAASAFREACRLNKNALALNALAQALEQSGKIQEAIVYGKEAVHLRADSDLYNRLANLYIKAGKTEDALQSLSLAVQAGPAPDALNAIYRQQGYLYAQLGRHEAARVSFIRALRLKPGDSELQLATAAECIELRDYREAIPYLERAKALLPSSKALRMLALAYSESGDLDRAVVTYQELLSRASHPSQEAEQIETSLGYLETRRNNFEQAGTYFLRAFQDGSEQQARLLYEAAQKFFLAERWKQAQELHLRYLTRPDVAPDAKATAWENLAFTYAKLRQQRAAADSLLQAIAHGRDSAKIRLNLAFSYYELREWKLALDQFLASVRKEQSARSLAGAARCYQHLNKPGLAIYYLNQALEMSRDLPDSEQQPVLAELGYLYNSIREYASAATVFEKSLRLKNDPAIYLQLARARRLLGEYLAAERALLPINPSDLSGQLKVEYLDERAALMEKRGDIQASIEDLVRANQIAPAAWRDYQLGLRGKNEKNWPDAIAHFKAALAKEPEKEEYTQALAYTFEAAGQLHEAARLFETLRSRNPDDTRWYKSLGYINMRLSRNAEAAACFRQAIDHSGPDQGDDETTRDNYLSRAEVRRLVSRYEMTLYRGFVSNAYARNGAVDFLGVAPFPAPMGIEVAYRPPGIGLRNGRIFQVFGRLLWNSDDANPFRFDSRFYQGSLGIRYKPLERQNLWISAERLLHSGTVATESWLLRGLYSWNPGFEVKPNKRAWNYSLAFSDSSYMLGGDGDFAQYGEVRRGRTINFHNSLLVTPHVVADARWQSAKGMLGSYAEAGAGVSLRFLFNQNRYEVARSSFEVLFQCKRGDLSPKTGFPSAGIGYGGCTAMMIARF